jgi:hypothetical protein
VPGESKVGFLKTMCADLRCLAWNPALQLHDGEIPAVSQGANEKFALLARSEEIVLLDAGNCGRAGEQS